MGFLNIVRKGVAIANSLTADLQPEVVHRRWQSQTTAGVGTFTDAPQPALVTLKQRLVKDRNGTMVTSTAQIVFLNPGVIVDVRDKIRLPGEPFTSPGRSIINWDGFADRITGKPILTEVFLG